MKLRQTRQFHHLIFCLILLLLPLMCQSVVTPYDHSTMTLVLQHKTPSIFLLTTNSPPYRNASAIYQIQPKSLILLQFHKTADKYYKQHPETLPQNTENYAEKLLFIQSDQNDGLFTYDPLVELLGVQEYVKKRGSCVIYRDNLGKKYLYDNKKYTTENILAFIQEIKVGNYPIFYMSEPLDHYQASKNKVVRNLVGKNFNQVISNSEKQQFVLFYTPYCHKSRVLMNYFFKTAQSIKKNPHIQFSKINLLKNQIPPNPSLHSIPSSFTKLQNQTPFMYLFRKNKSQPAIKFTTLKPYQSSYDYLLKWIKENTEYQWVRSQEPSQQVYQQL